LFFETGSHCVAQAGLELAILPPQPPKCWDDGSVPLGPAEMWVLSESVLEIQTNISNLNLEFQGFYLNYFVFLSLFLKLNVLFLDGINIIPYLIPLVIYLSRFQATSNIINNIITAKERKFLMLSSSLTCIPLRCTVSQAWCHTPIIPELGRLRQEDCEFEARLVYRGKSKRGRRRRRRGRRWRRRGRWRKRGRRRRRQVYYQTTAFIIT
jgi:hypothetical protein